PGGTAFHCATLTVPLDHGLLPRPRVAGQLSLEVAMTGNAHAPRGVLVWLTGGPGGPGVPLAATVANQLDPAVLRDYRLVMINQRGTGPGALRCPQLQQAMGNSDLTVPPAGVVQDCAQSLGPDRRFFSTTDTVADLDTLRQALGVDKLALDAISYGTLVAARYVIIHPDRVSRLVLDSVVPHYGVDPLQTAVLGRTADVLRTVCKENGCVTDPAQDLSEVVRRRKNGPMLLDTLTGMSVGKPRLTALPAALHEAARGDDAPLDAIIATAHRDSTIAADKLSQGLHATTTCQDMHGPWGNAASPVTSRAAATQQAVAALPEAALFPFDRATATGNGTVVTCQEWPSTPVVAFPTDRDLPDVPVLLLAGDHDLATPLLWAQQEAAHTPHGHLVVIPGSGHITQHADNGPLAQEAVKEFLTGP
ncbi:MAG: alpha/beta hydrolase, partial [Pseudonocardiaceae bacterium]